MNTANLSKGYSTETRMALSGKVCLVTGASRGIGKGIAVQLGEAGATVYITGRSSSAEAAVVGGSLQETESEISSRGGKGIAVVCDHSNDDQVKSVFERIKEEHGKLDILVNNAYAAVSFIFNEMKTGSKFWESKQEPGECWDIVNRVGLRNHYICSTYAAQMMVEAKQGLIVNVSSFGGQRYLFNVPYGVGKAAVDRMSADMAVELNKYAVACVTLYPGPVLTEQIDHVIKTSGDSDRGKGIQRIFAKGETPEFSGRAVVGLASDPNIMTKSGKICLCADLAKTYGFTDVNGSQPPSMLQLNTTLASAGHTWIASLIPNFVRIPGFIVAMGTSKF